MKSLFTTRYSSSSFNVALLVLRLGFGILLMYHGYDKMQHFDTMKTQFISFMGLSPSMSLSLVIFAELFCSALVVLGLLTRLATIPIIITMVVAIAKAHNYDITGQGQAAALYLFGFLAILFLGAGKASVDGAIGK